MAIYKRTGDKGKTSLFGGMRVDKDHVRIEALGSLDEANSRIGYLRAKLDSRHPWQENLRRIQMDLMNLMSHVARPASSEKVNPNPLPEEGALFCEEWMEQLESEMTPSEHFLLPGGTEISALCHLVRTQLREAERRVVTLHRQEELPPPLLAYLNRLSDLFFVLSRHELHTSPLEEERWNLFRYKRRGEKKEGAE